MGHAGKALGVLARRQGRELADVAAEAGASLVAGSSLNAALDLNWDDPAQRAQGWVQVLDALTAVETWRDDPSVQASLAAAEQVGAQEPPGNEWRWPSNGGCRERWPGVLQEARAA